MGQDTAQGADGKVGVVGLSLAQGTRRQDQLPKAWLQLPLNSESSQGQLMEWRGLKESGKRLREGVQ